MAPSPYAGLGHVDPEAQASVDAAVLRLSGVPRRPQRDLGRLAYRWFSSSSCFRLPRRAAPTVEGVRVAARFVGHPDVHVAVTALAALGSAAVVLSRRAFPSLPSSWADVPDASAAVTDALSDDRVPVRLAASRLVADFPDPSVRQRLRGRLADPVYTVRWHAVRALARLGDTDGLDVVLAESRPRTARDDYDAAAVALTGRVG